MFYKPGYEKNPAQTELQRCAIIKITRRDVLHKDGSLRVFRETWHVYGPCLLESAHFSM